MLRRKRVSDGSSQHREIRFVGLARSGNHAIINWVLNQLPGRYCFLNCTEPKTNPFCSARPLDSDGQVYISNIPGIDIEQERKGYFSDKEFLLYSHEDCFLGALNHSCFLENRERWLGRPAETQDVMILRDPFNLFASRIKSKLLRGHYTCHGAKPISVTTLKRIYKQHAREFFRQKTNLHQPLLINYNRWVADLSYRASLADELALPFTDKGFTRVAKVAGGSSFDGLQWDGKAHNMKVNSRWKEFAEDESYWQLFDDELVELSHKIFGTIAPVRYYQQLSSSSLGSVIT